MGGTPPPPHTHPTLPPPQQPAYARRLHGQTTGRRKQGRRRGHSGCRSGGKGGRAKTPKRQENGKGARGREGGDRELMLWLCVRVAAGQRAKGGVRPLGGWGVGEGGGVRCVCSDDGVGDAVLDVCWREAEGLTRGRQKQRRGSPQNPPRAPHSKKEKGEKEGGALPPRGKRALGVSACCVGNNRRSSSGGRGGGEAGRIVFLGSTE